MPQKIEISHRTIIFTVFFLILLQFLYIVREIILQLFVALLIMAVLNPLITRLSRYKVPRVLSILVVYLVMLSVISFSIAAIIPPLAEQTTAFINNFPRLTARVGLSSVISEQLTRQVLGLLTQLPSQAAKFTVSIFSNVISVVTVLVFAFYLLSDRARLEAQIGVLIGEKKVQKFSQILKNLEKRMGGWAWGQISLMFIIGLSNYIGLSLLGIQFALPLAILAGLLEIVPYIGPILAAIPAVLIGFGISPILGFAVIAMAFLIQQLENYVFVPQVMKKSTGVHPVITLAALTIGFKLSGVVGLLISVPIYIIIQELAKEYLLKEK